MVLLLLYMKFPKTAVLILVVFKNDLKCFSRALKKMRGGSAIKLLDLLIA